MILEDGKPLRRPLPWRISDYLWGIFPALASLFAAVALWQYGHAHLGAMLIPAPDVVFARAVNILANASERQNVILTLYRASIGISLALTIGISAGLIAGSSRTLSLLTRPIITVLLGTPPIIWVVLAIFWYNMGSTSVIFTVTITTLPLVFAAAQMSVMTLPTPLSEMLSSYRVPLARRLK
ncbi:MAG: ABC transporter permease, partial [Cardiobacterium hominis]